LVFTNAFQDIAFVFASWFHEAVVPFGSTFQLSRFKSVRSISHSVGDDRAEKMFVEHPPESGGEWDNRRASKLRSPSFQRAAVLHAALRADLV
jgi:hypothetical protein